MGIEGTKAIRRRTVLHGRNEVEDRGGEVSCLARNARSGSPRGLPRGVDGQGKKLGLPRLRQAGRGVAVHRPDQPIERGRNWSGAQIRDHGTGNRRRHRQTGTAENWRTRDRTANAQRRTVTILKPSSGSCAYAMVLKVLRLLPACPGQFPLGSRASISHRRHARLCVAASPANR